MGRGGRLQRNGGRLPRTSTSPTSSPSTSTGVRCPPIVVHSVPVLVPVLGLVLVSALATLATLIAEVIILVLPPPAIIARLRTAATASAAAVAVVVVAAAAAEMASLVVARLEILAPAGTAVPPPRRSCPCPCGPVIPV